jgi:DNA-binding winged helix-turn-helix (wHTH) protein/Tol biopolymer transport system component
MEETFSFGRFQVSATRRELLADGMAAPIGARALDVLILLLRHPGELVTKDQLFAEVWAGAAVEDNAIAAQISAVRRALGDGVDGARFVQTVPGRGYRFIAAVTTGETQAVSRESPLGARLAPVGLPGGGVGLALAGAALAGLLAAVAVAVWLLAPHGWAIEHMEVSAGSPMVETDAAPSPNGTMLAYAAGADRAARRIFLKSLTGGEALAFTQGEGDEFAPAWSPSGDRIAFVRAQEGQPCTILVKSVPAGPERAVGHCRTMARTVLGWAAKGDGLYFNDRDTPEAPNRIQLLDVASGRISGVTRPPAGSDGDHGPIVSPDGRRLAFARETDVLPVYVVHDLASGAEHTITGKALNTAGAAWAGDNALLVATARPDDSALWIYDLAGGAPHRLTFNPAEFSRVVGNGAGLFGFESHTFRHALAFGAATATAAPDAIEPGSGMINGLTFNREGVVTYAQAPEGSGPWDVWVKRPGRPAEQLTNLKASYLEAPRWSPDGRRIAFLATIGRSPALYVIGADGSGLRQIITRAAWMGGPDWSPDGRCLIYPELDGRDWRLWRVELDGPRAAGPLDAHGWYAVRSDGRDLYGLNVDKGGVWRLGAAPRLITPNASIQHAMDWDVAGGKLVYLDRTRPGAPRLIVHDLNGGADRAYWAPRPLSAGDDDSDGQGGIGGVGLDPRSMRPVYVHVTEDNSNVGFFRLVRR